MEADSFTQFCQPTQNGEGNWYVRSTEADMIGDFRYLTFGLEDGPRLHTILDAHNAGVDILCQTYGEANDELKFYYEYHKRPDLYNALMYGLKPNDSDDVESQVMTFNP